LAGGVFFVGGLVYGVMSGVAVPLQDPTSAERDLEKFHVQISQWLMVVGGCLLAGVFCLALGKEIIRQLFRS
jgi:O-antigen/teichoic acid export membrane protein